MNIKWLNGDSKNHFIIEMIFSDGKRAYLKNRNYPDICSRYESLWNNPAILGLTLYNTKEEVVATKYRAAG